MFDLIFSYLGLSKDVKLFTIEVDFGGFGFRFLWVVKYLTFELEIYHIMKN